MVSVRRTVKILLYMTISVLCIQAAAYGQTVVDTLALTPLPPDSFYVRREGSNVVIGWYARDDTESALIGSYDFRNWFTERDVSEGVQVDLLGSYIGNVDLTILVERESPATTTVGVDTSIILYANTVDPRNFTYRQRMNIGANYYTPGQRIPAVLVNEEPPFDSLVLGIEFAFSEGIVDTSLTGGLAFFEFDLHDFEGFHIWRGLTPFPSDMQVIAELSKEDGYIGVEEDMLYYEDWPQYDDFGREYYEYTDENIYVGFTYYYIVTTYDRGYFKGFFQHNKWDNYICEDDDPRFEQYYDPPEGPVACEEYAQVITMSVDAGNDVSRIYAVPNPYRTGTSAETSPFYHNFPDMTIKFFNVPDATDIKIYTVSGDLVWESSHSSPDGTNGIISWDARNKEGQDVGSGVYVYRCETTGGDGMYGRIVVIR
jgi:hypothetical protein